MVKDEFQIRFVKFNYCKVPLSYKGGGRRGGAGVKIGQKNLWTPFVDGTNNEWNIATFVSNMFN